MGRAPCCDKMGVKRGPWTIQEDQILVSYIKNHGHSNWRALPKQAGLLRCGKICRLRWTNYLRPDIKRGNFSLKEEETILKMHQLIGNRWSVIASYLPGRTDNEIKNVWNTSLKKRLVHMEANSLTDALPLPAKSSSFDSSTVEMADHGWNPLQNSIIEDKIECQPFSGERIFIFKNQTYLEEPVQLPISHDKTETVTSSQGRPDCNGEILIRDHRVNSVNLLVGSPMQNFYGQEVDWLLHHPVDMSSMDSTVGTKYHQIWRKDFQVGEGMDYWVNILRQFEPLPVSHIAPACEALSSISTAVQL